MLKEYRPSREILEKYAHVLVNFALNGGRGIRKGDTVFVAIHEYAKPLYGELCKAILRAGGHIIGDYRPDPSREYNFDKEFLEISSTTLTLDLSMWWEDWVEAS